MTSLERRYVVYFILPLLSGGLGKFLPPSPNSGVTRNDVGSRRRPHSEQPEVGEVWRPDRWAPSEIIVEDLLAQMQREAAKEAHSRARDLDKFLDIALAASADNSDILRQWLDKQMRRHEVQENEHHQRRFTDRKPVTTGTTISRHFGKFHPPVWANKFEKSSDDHQQRQNVAASSSPASTLTSLRNAIEPADGDLLQTSDDEDARPRMMAAVPARLKRSSASSTSAFRLGRFFGGSKSRHPSTIDVRDANDLHPVYLGLGPRAVGAAMMTMAEILGGQRHVEGPKMSTRFIG